MDSCEGIAGWSLIDSSFIVPVNIRTWMNKETIVVPRYNGLLGGKPCPLKPIVRYKNNRHFDPKNVKDGRFFFGNLDVTDKIGKK